MTANEQTFLRKQLEVLLKRLKRNLEKAGEEALKTTYRRGYMELLRDIRQTAEDYVKEIIFCGMGGYFQREEIPALFEQLNSVVNEAGFQKELRSALFKEPDMEKVEELTRRMKNQVSQIILEYQAHTAV